MRVFERYLYAELLRAWCVVNLMLLGLFSFFDLAAQLDDVGRGGYTTGHALIFELGQLPQRLVELTPFAALLSVVVALGLMAGRRELVIVRGVGMSPLQIAASVGRAGVVLLVLVLAIQSFVAPPLAQSALRLRASAIAGGGAVNDASVWLRSRAGVVHIGALENGRVPADIDIVEFGDDRTVHRYLHAARAEIEANGDWRLHDVRDKNPRNATSTHHAALTYTPGLYARQIKLLELPPASLAPRSLYRYSRYLRARDQSAQRFEIALWQKITLPVMTLALLLLGLPLVFANPRGANFGARMAAATGIGLAAYAAMQAIGNLAFVFELSAPLCLLAPGLLIGFGAVVWLRRLD